MKLRLRSRLRLRLGGAGHSPGVIELFQAEWCPHSHKVRQRLTELGVDFVARQVAAEKEERPGELEIPTLVTEDGEKLSGEDEILPWLDEHFEERPDARRHRAKARVEVKEFEEVASA
jgi:glutathione S-transferase